MAYYELSESVAQGHFSPSWSTSYKLISEVFKAFFHTSHELTFTNTLFQKTLTMVKALIS